MGKQSFNEFIERGIYFEIASMHVRHDRLVGINLIHILFNAVQQNLKAVIL
jgi:hypothetical protein